MRICRLPSWNILLRSIRNPFGLRTVRRSPATMTKIEQFEDRVLLTAYTVLNNADSGGDSLRQAILDANANPGADTIVFNLDPGSLVIQPTTLLPGLTDPVTIDGTTQPGFAGIPLVVISGSLLPSQTFGSGLEIDTSNSTIKSLVVQGFSEGEGILIGGFGSSGVTGNHIEGCYIGVNAAGTAAAPNGNGIRIANGAQDNVVGGTAGQGNVISGNLGYGILVQDSGTTGNRIEGNTLGASADRTTAIGNGYGVAVGEGASNNTIGGLVAGASNLISGNVDYGISLVGSDVSGMVIQGNLIGTNAAGSAALGDFTAVAGISLSGGTHDNLIGGTTAAARNIIAGTAGTGIRISGSGTANNTIHGNFLGVDATGSSSIAIGDDGIFIEGANLNLIGGTAVGTGNVISGTERHGVVIFGGTATGNTVQGNRIGTTASGTAAIPNGSDGIRVDGAPDNTIGGAAAGAGNLISGNTQNGITLTEPGCEGNIVQGNLLGVQVDGTSPLPNGIDGLDVNFSASNNQIGGRNAGEGNIIAFNAIRGLEITGNSTLGNSLLGNSIHSNATFEVDLNSDLTTANDALDADVGPNGLQNYPVMTSAVSSSGSLTVQGTFNSSASSTFTVDFYASSANDPSGLGQGQIYLGSQTVTTSPAGSTGFAATLSVNVAVGNVVTAMATDASGNTSEFSASVAVSAASPNPVLILSGAAVSYSPRQAPVVLDAAALVTDADSPNFNGGQLVVKLSPRGKGSELLAIRNQGTGAGQIAVVDGTVQFGGTAIGTFVGSKGKKSLVVTFNGNATSEAVQALVRNITYHNKAKRLKTPTRTAQFQITDDAGHSSALINALISFAN